MAGAEDIDYEVEDILGKRETEDGITQYLVRWKGFNSDWDSWEPVHNLGNCTKIIDKYQKSRKHSSKHMLKIIPKNEEVTSSRNTSKDYDSKRSKTQTLKAMRKKQKTKKGVPVKVIVVKGQRKVKVLGNQKNNFVKINKRQGKKLKGKKQLIAVDNEVSFSVRKNNSCNHRTSSGSERKKIVSAHMSEIFDAVLAKSGTEESSHKVGKVQKNQGSEKVETKMLSVRKIRNNAFRMNQRKVRPGTADKGRTRSLSAGMDKKESHVPASRSVRKLSAQGEAQKVKKTAQRKSLATETLATDKDRKKKSAKSDRSEMPSDGAKTKDTSKIDELYNHLLEQVRAATPPTKPSKHTVTAVKNMLKSAKPKGLSPKSSPVKINKTLGSQTNQAKQANKDLKNKKQKVNIQIIRVDLPKKEMPADTTTKEKPKTKPVFGQKRKASDPVTIETDDESNSDDGVLYSLSDMEESDTTPTKSPESAKQKSSLGVGKDVKEATKAKINKKVLKVVKSQSDSGLEKSQKPKKIRLLDSLTKPAAAKPVRPVSPTPLFTSVKTAAVMPTTSRRNNRAAGGIPMYQYVIQPSAAIPVSPTSMSYKMLLENLPHQLHPKKSKNKSENGDEDVERRISVRASECAFKYKEIIIKKCHKYTQIWLYTHTKMKNSLNPQVILELQSALNAAKYDDSNLVMLSGLDNVFCSGIDLQFLQSGDKKVAARQMVDALRDFTKTLITFPKLIVAVVTGPAIGLGMTMLPLCDVVYASDKATFFLPYAQLAQTPEGCASYTLPQAMGMAMANELMIGGRKITAIEACQLGLVSQVYWPTSMMQEVIPRIQLMAQSSGKVLETTKLLIRSHQRTKLDLTNESESNLLLERWTSAECQKAITEFLNDEKNYVL